MMSPSEVADDHFEDDSSTSTDESEFDVAEDVEDVAEEVEDPTSYTVRMCSDYRVVPGKIKWRISHINRRIKRTKRNRPLGSPIFPVRDNLTKADYRFRLALYLNGVENDPQSDDHVSVFLVNANRDQGMVVKYHFFIVGSDGRRHHVSPRYTSYFGASDSWGETELVSKSLLKEKNKRLLQGDSLVLVCQLEIRLKADRVDGPVPEPRETQRKRATLASYLYSEMKEGVVTDVVVICQDKRLPCHKTVLSARSDVFRAMFEHKNTLESNRGEIEVNDVSPEVMQKLLEFLYLDSVAEVGSHAADLFVAADKYNVPELKEAMERAMAESLSVENVSDVLILVDHHGCSTGLDKMAAEFAARNMAEVMRTESWDIVTRLYPAVVDNIVQFPVDFSRKRDNGDGTGGIVAHLPKGNSNARSLELLARAASMELE